MKKIILIAVLAATAQLQAQQITSTGLGIAGDGIYGDPQPYNISILDGSGGDGTNGGVVKIVINGKNWSVFAPSPNSSAFCRVVKWDAVKGKWVQYGFIKATTDDGTAFLAGIIFIKTAPVMKVIGFKGIAFYTPKTMPTVNISSEIAVYQYQPSVGKYIKNPNWTIGTTFVSGAIWVNHDGSVIQSGVLDGFGTISIVPVPPPSGGAQNLPIMPARMF